MKIQAAILPGLLTLIVQTSAHAGWFRNSEQQALDRFQAGDFNAAAEAFSDPLRRGIALYRANRFDEAEDAFGAVERASVRTTALYNLGNARFMQGDFTGAIDAYQQVLRAEPDHDDAHNNLALAHGLLAKQEQLAFAQDEQQAEQEQLKEEDAALEQQDRAEAEQQGQQEGEQEQQDERQGDEQQGEQQDEQQGEQGSQGEPQRNQQRGQQAGEGEQGQESGQGAQGQASDQQQASEISDGAERLDHQPGSSGDEQTETGDASERQRDSAEGGGQQRDRGEASGKEPGDDANNKLADTQDPGDEDSSGGEREPRDEADNGEAAEQRDGGGEGGELPEQDGIGKAESELAEQDQPGASGGQPEAAVGGERQPSERAPDQSQAGEADQEAAGTAPEGSEAEASEAEASGPGAAAQAGQAQPEPGPDRQGSGGQPPPRQDGPDLNQPAGESDAVERFDQQGAVPWADSDPALGLRGQSALGGEQALGPGMALMEQRLEQIEGDPSLLMRNQFQIEELRQLRESGGRVQEARPW